MSESEEGLDAVLVCPSVSHIDIFLILFVDDLMVGPPCAGIRPCGMCATVFQPCIPGEWEFSAWVDSTCKHIGKGFTRLRTQEPSLYHCRHLVEPRHGHGIARDIDEHYVFIHLYKSLHQFILGIGQSIFFTVVSLTILIVALVQSSDNDNIVGFHCFAHGLAEDFAFAPGVGQVLSGGHAIIRSRGVAHISTGILHTVSQTFFQALPRRNLMLCFQR